jgi:imidazolonepropionase-like amidohydrolase
VALFQPVPTGGIVAGQSGLVAADGWTTERMVINRHVGLDVFWPAMALDTSPGGRGRKVKSLSEQAKARRTKQRELNEFFEEARAYAHAREAATKGGTPAPEPIPAWEAMVPYVTGQRPVIVHADEVRQISAAVEWAATNHYRIVISGGRDAWMVAGLLASNQVPVIYSDTFSMVARDTEPYDVHFKAPLVLHQAGVKVAFGIGLDTMAASLAKNLPCSAAQAVAFGLPPDEALKGLTLYSAQISGVADRLGSIDAGKDATLFAADGDILANDTRVTHLWIGGKEVSLESRHTRLYDKYRNRPKN